jgi:hypothetical protein
MVLYNPLAQVKSGVQHTTIFPASTPCPRMAMTREESGLNRNENRNGQLP